MANYSDEYFDYVDDYAEDDEGIDGDLCEEAFDAYCEDVISGIYDASDKYFLENGLLGWEITDINHEHYFSYGDDEAFFVCEGTDQEGNAWKSHFTIFCDSDGFDGDYDEGDPEVGAYPGYENVEYNYEHLEEDIESALSQIISGIEDLKWLTQQQT